MEAASACALMASMASGFMRAYRTALFFRGRPAPSRLPPQCGLLASIFAIIKLRFVGWVLLADNITVLVQLQG